MSPPGDKIEYQALADGYPWVTQRERHCILSTDSDGLLCGLLVTNYLDWVVAGYYDGKILVSKRGQDINDCIFLDVEINRCGIGSIGNHLVEYNRSIEITNHNFQSCIQPNMLRGFDGKNSFQRKYPFATVHLLLGILQAQNVIEGLPNTAISPLLFVDGVCNNLFGYPENCLDWISFLRIDEKTHILHKFLCANDFNFYQVMHFLKEFFAIRDQHNAKGFFSGGRFIEGGSSKRTGHKVRITDGRGQPINLVERDDTFDLHDVEVGRVQGFIEELARAMNWQFLPSRWNWTDFALKVFTKGRLSGRAETPDSRLNNRTYQSLFGRDPFSLAMTASDEIEYTVE